MRHRIFIPDRFTRSIAIHVVKNLLPQDHIRAPLILGIHGPSGEGKTYQCEQVLFEMGVEAFLISGGQLESREAGEPAKLLRDTYINASRSVQQGKCKAAVVLINDVDTGLGNWGEMVQYTTNRQMVFGELMHLVDYPTTVEKRATSRIPIILTGNDFTKMYEPLVRAGRMRAFEWNPTLEEKAQIVSYIFPELNLEECLALVSKLNAEAQALLADRYRPLPLSFFSDLRASLIDEILWARIQKAGLTKVIDRINNGGQPILQVPIFYGYLIEEGRKLIKSGQLINHLRT